MGYFDPPEYPDGPECPSKDCEGWGEFVEQKNGFDIFACDECGCGFEMKAAAEWEDSTPNENEWGLLEPEEEEACPHGKQFLECGSCLEASDRAYEEIRERGFRFK